MVKHILIATKNAGKAREFKKLFSEKGIEVKTLLDMENTPEIDENGKTFTENALIKAQTLTDLYKIPVLADDSGIVVDYLNGEPGIYSARYMGEDTSYRIKNQNLIDRLEGVPDEKRTARFVCAIAAVFPDGREFVVRGTVEGRIGYEEKGENGFGYDPIFYLPERGMTTAQLPPEEKNSISHRGNALRLCEERLKELL